MKWMKYYVMCIFSLLMAFDSFSQKPEKEKKTEKSNECASVALVRPEMSNLYAGYTGSPGEITPARVCGTESEIKMKSGKDEFYRREGGND
ncbi:MAG: hypothetical protein K2X86_10680 [Cytophagaceae bacterium]|nr:hypothetical protein [Cytophagaceae bacterium]